MLVTMCLYQFGVEIASFQIFHALILAALLLQNYQRIHYSPDPYKVNVKSVFHTLGLALVVNQMIYWMDPHTLNGIFPQENAFIIRKISDVLILSMFTMYVYFATVAVHAVMDKRADKKRRRDVFLGSWVIFMLIKLFVLICSVITLKDTDGGKKLKLRNPEWRVPLFTIDFWANGFVYIVLTYMLSSSMLSLHKTVTQSRRRLSQDLGADTKGSSTQKHIQELDKARRRWWGFSIVAGYTMTFLLGLSVFEWSYLLIYGKSPIDLHPHSAYKFHWSMILVQIALAIVLMVVLWFAWVPLTFGKGESGEGSEMKSNTGNSKYSRVKSRGSSRPLMSRNSSSMQKAPDVPQIKIDVNDKQGDDQTQV
eukprot:15254_1